MAKYHINPFSGEPNVCSAKIKCPFGDLESDHFATQAAARAAYEMRMREEARVELLVKHGKMLDLYAAGVDPDYIDRLAARMAVFEEQEKKMKEREETLAEELKTRRAARTYLADEELGNINVDGIRCPHCGGQINAKQAAHILNEMNNADCTDCGQSYDLYSVDIKVGESKDTYAAFDAAEVPKMTWYHSTNSEDWDSYFEKEDGFVAHLGSQQAAYDRRLAEDYSTYGDHAGFWLFEVRVGTDACIAEKVAPDDNADYGNGDHMGKNDVVRYINKWEDMASISLAAKSSQLTVKSKRFVTAKEVMSSPSLYNVTLS